MTINRCPVGSSEAQSGAPLLAEVASVLDHLVREARRLLPLRRVILFGSRARGDARPLSDLDVAFEHAGDDAAWANFVNTQQDTAPTLLALDLVDLGSAEPGLRQKILAEGRQLWGSEPSTTRGGQHG